MESKNTIIYKWEHRVYDLRDMAKLVQNNIITKEEFFDITRYNFDGIAKKYLKKRKFYGII